MMSMPSSAPRPTPGSSKGRVKSAVTWITPLPELLNLLALGARPLDAGPNGRRRDGEQRER
jgi:hypothetical protein